MNHLRIALPEIGQNVRNYVNWIRATGMDPVVISVSHEASNHPVHQEYLDYSDFNIDYYDGLLLPGGMDLNPARYGEENAGTEAYYDPLDAFQMDILGRFVREKKPVFGICRGMQLINVFFGGTLIQHLETSYLHRAATMRAADAVHESRAAQGSWLEGFYGAQFPHNSCHHQAVKEPGAHLVIDMRSTQDDVIEALHHETLPIYGVQWHPERMSLENMRDDTVEGLPLMFFFAGLCIRDREQRGQVEAPDLSGIIGL